jgi:hypothetical protein
LFWHTDHFASAGTATHRSFSRQTIIEDRQHSLEDGPAAAYHHEGSGPSLQHVYAQGLLNYYYLTGDSNAKDAVLELAEFVMNFIYGPVRTIQLLKEIAKTNIKWMKMAIGANKVSPYGLLEGPDRGSGNALSVLMDAYVLTREKRYLSTAELIIRECVHPMDELEKKDLFEINTKWSYTIFMQSVGKYLDIKMEMGEFDSMFFYAKDTVVHYALWMLDREVPIMTHSGSFDYPNFETRVANDIRKANILYIASKYSSGKSRDALRDRGGFFFENSIKTLLDYDTRAHTRPLAIVMQNMHTSMYFHNRTELQVITGTPYYDHGKPQNRNTLKWLLNENRRFLNNLFRSFSKGVNSFVH